MRALGDRDTVLLADFVNTTGEPVFDGTLKQAPAVQLEQSPFLNIFPETRIREGLRYMGRSPDERLTNTVALEKVRRQLRSFRRSWIIAELTPLPPCISSPILAWAVRMP